MPETACPSLSVCVRQFKIFGFKRQTLWKTFIHGPFSRVPARDRDARCTRQTCTAAPPASRYVLHLSYGLHIFTPFSHSQQCVMALATPCSYYAWSHLLYNTWCICLVCSGGAAGTDKVWRIDQEAASRFYLPLNK